MHISVKSVKHYFSRVNLNTVTFLLCKGSTPHYASDTVRVCVAWPTCQFKVKHNTSDRKC